MQHPATVLPSPPDPASDDTGIDDILAEIARDGASPEALDELLGMVYHELRALASARLRGMALAHEAWLRISGRVLRCEAGWDGRRHFFHSASRAMRDVLVERARRRRHRQLRESVRAIDPSRLIEPASAPPEELLALDAALRRLAETEPRQHEIVVLRFFGGLGSTAIAEILGISERTVKRDWRLARAALHADLASGQGTRSEDRTVDDHLEPEQARREGHGSRRGAVHA
jgi:RNA polymerase sigma-70 factor (ECF subfamily)